MQHAREFLFVQRSFANGMIELLIRTRDLLLAAERLDDQQHSESGKAVVFGTFSTP